MTTTEHDDAHRKQFETSLPSHIDGESIGNNNNHGGSVFARASMKCMTCAFVFSILLGTLNRHVAASDLQKNETMPSPDVLLSSINVQHILIVSDKPFEDVQRNLEADLPKLDVSIIGALRNGDHSFAADYEKNGPELSIFLKRDHGLLLQILDKPGKSIQYEIGNPLTATKMTRYQLAAALYAPLRVVLYADENGKGVFEYEKPSSLFGQYGDPRVLDVAYGLDASIEKALRKAATK